MTYLRQRGITTTENNCKVKTTIEVNSEQYEKDKAYSESIDKTLNKLFSNDVNPTK